MAEDELINLGHLKQSMRRMDDEFIDNEEFKSALREAQESGEFDGVSIVKVEQTTTSTADSGENVITVTLSNGTVATFKVRNGSKGSTGPQGPKGDTGATGPQGEKGATGATGNGIKSAVLNDNYTLTLTFTDGTSYTSPSIRGATGAQGAKGDTGATGATGPQGEKGEKGDTGAAGSAATINGMNALTVKGGIGVSVTQEGTELTISTAEDYNVYDKLMEHCWARQPLDANAVEGENINLIILTTTSSSAAGDIYYSDTILAENGNVTLTDPQSVKVGYDTHTAAEVLIGKYFSSAATGANVYKIDEAATVFRYTQYVGTHPTLGVDMYKYSVTISPARLVTFADSDSWDYVYSAQRDAYPDSGSDGTFVYEYRGVPIENASSPLRMQYGSYVGTGTYGEKNALSLTFDFVPKLLMIFSPTTSYTLWFASRTMDYSVEDASTTAAIVEWNGNTVSWYATSSSNGAKNMRNTSGTTYHWVAIG